MDNILIKKYDKTELAFSNFKSGNAHIILEPYSIVVLNLDLCINNLNLKVDIYDYAKFDFKLICYTGNLNWKIDINLLGKHAHANVLGRFLIEDSSSNIINIAQNHLATYTESSVILKKVLKKSSKFESRANIFIDKTAVDSDSFFKDFSLLLDDTSSAISVPAIEVLTSQVKNCKHESAVGKINQDHLFYLYCRGLDDTIANEMIIKSVVLG